MFFIRMITTIRKVHMSTSSRSKSIPNQGEFSQQTRNSKLGIPMDSATLHSLISTALEAKSKAYCIYSKFQVGAALLGKSGRIYPGCNVESASYGLTICAERTAFVSAIASGETAFRGIVVIGDTEEAVSPCGACRQFMLEFGPDIEVVMVPKEDSHNETKWVRMTTMNLLPYGFSPQHLHDSQAAQRTPRT
jgi:cytidine deaminase